jgi:hypothetical protein
MTEVSPPAEIASPLVREMFVYWQRKSAGRIAPRPRDIDPGDIKRLLPFISISATAWSARGWSKPPAMISPGDSYTKCR